MGTHQEQLKALERLAELRDGIQALTGERVPLIIQAREVGCTWSEIGRMLGMSPQGAQQAYSSWKRTAYTSPIPDDQDPMFD